MRGVIERAISTCGADILDGATIWARLVELLMEELEDVADTPHTAHSSSSSQQAVQMLKESIVSTYRRQFSIPLLGNQAHLLAFEKTLSELCIESDASWIKPEVLLEKFQRSEEQLKDRIIYESNIGTYCASHN